ncbi:MAG: hypothetical protein APF80_09900 [Alphaproteobacteria bacterium BRH_c36]|nr:MAG: hypothetical protein APF80_09900 [Alphaproteobacteria bacterium BRH_c36]
METLEFAGNARPLREVEITPEVRAELAAANSAFEAHERRVQNLHEKLGELVGADAAYEISSTCEWHWVRRADVSLRLAALERLLVLAQRPKA